MSDFYCCYTLRRLGSGGVYHRFTVLLIDIRLLVDDTEFQKFCHDKVILFLIEVNILLLDIFSIVLFSIFLLARKAA